MSWFSLNKAMGTNYTVDPGDIVNTKVALNQLGYYDVPPHRGVDDWTDDAMFSGIRAFQKDNGLKIDGFMRPGGPTETAINKLLQLTSEDADDGLSDGPITIPPRPPLPPIQWPSGQPRPPVQPRPAPPTPPTPPTKPRDPPIGGIRG